MNGRSEAAPRRITALNQTEMTVIHHEAGHVVMACWVGYAIKEITFGARAGVVRALPICNVSATDLLPILSDRLCMLLAGAVMQCFGARGKIDRGDIDELLKSDAKHDFICASELANIVRALGPEEATDYDTSDTQAMMVVEQALVETIDRTSTTAFRAAWAELVDAMKDAGEIYASSQIKPEVAWEIAARHGLVTQKI